MTTYNLNYQIGDVILFNKKISISTLTKSNFPTSTPLKQLPNNNADLPQYLPQLCISPQLISNKMTVIADKLYYIRSIYNNYYIKLNDFDSFEHYLEKFSSKSRKSLKRKVRKAETAEFSYQIYQTVEEVDEFHTYACQVGEQTYQKRLFDSSIPTDLSYREQIKSQAEQNNFLGLILFKDGHACAYLYLPIVNNQYIYAYLGYVQQHSAYSPGTVLQYYAFNEIFSQKLKADYFNFTEGDGQHKKFFATDKQTCCNCLVVKNSFKMRCYLKLQLMCDGFSAWLGQTLDKYKLREKIKKIIRRG
ncbi:MAG: GNAT family N-acetyltransferase [Gammaproteobacteria bacterium]|nr:GNAT family N-acetyltransferase [Gammaproteobacteria bacterium]